MDSQKDIKIGDMVRVFPIEAIRANADSYTGGRESLVCEKAIPHGHFLDKTRFYWGDEAFAETLTNRSFIVEFITQNGYLMVGEHLIAPWCVDKIDSEPIKSEATQDIASKEERKETIERLKNNRFAYDYLSPEETAIMREFKANGDVVYMSSEGFKPLKKEWCLVCNLCYRIRKDYEHEYDKPYIEVNKGDIIIDIDGDIAVAMNDFNERNKYDNVYIGGQEYRLEQDEIKHIVTKEELFEYIENRDKEKVKE